MRNWGSWGVLFGVCISIAAVQAAPLRPLQLGDLQQLREVSEPEFSPEGNWVAYAVKRPDFAADENDSDIWMSRWDGSEKLRLTTSSASEHTPRWSPDGRYLGFLADRPDKTDDKDDKDQGDQLWLLNRTGGEAEKITSFKGGVVDYVWSPDSRKLALIVEDPDPQVEEETVEIQTNPTAGDSKKNVQLKKTKTPKPIVIDRFQFKQDEDGYLVHRRKHLYLFDLATRQAMLLTPGDYDERLPAWSPDSKQIVFVSKRRAEADRDNNWDLYLIEAKAGAKPRQLTDFAGPDNDPDYESRPAWSPDGRQIAYLQGGPLKLIGYAVHALAVIPAAGGTPRLLSANLDRNVQHPSWSADGRSIRFIVEDDRTGYLASVPVAGGAISPLTSGRQMVEEFSAATSGRIAIVASTASTLPEVFALEGGKQLPLSRQNDDWLATVQLAPVSEIDFPSKDGTVIHGFLVKPPGYQSGRKYPALLRIHGGPVGQFGNSFSFEWQWLAANGYAVVAANPRGSSGRGEVFSKAIYADWGHLDAQDVLAAVDYAVAGGIADPERLGIGGWSYGGMLTNYTIAQDRRFKAAISGASIANILSGYGTDQYIRDYETELSTPWRNLEGWMKISFPFFHADRIATPTLFLCGEKDFNVPLLNSEQMYQALRSLGLDTQLVIYPGQHHGISKPSYRRDRLERYVAWYDRFLKSKTTGTTASR
ncbi:alpha/beta hydrolase family protein [Gloeobacter kilaueensis]|uniref:Peptidase S9 prolyl oligopeptidase active site domain protein n=1 Tax=Gloeobacter kilaueensis (strain ATCC BAA-2537 / CCAP 1431/1 / ULC 316 / JS1) TaxID=1183438 RepID=U5QHI7_GLOK1|nr:S9 family peptidase [Gloeobacter kilaueensis]AGY58328.1 peptidase S9 prolyl oligopeptidase active site domain protein [Gloeobacter kilaueensis JS1]